VLRRAVASVNARCAGVREPVVRWGLTEFFFCFAQRGALGQFAFAQPALALSARQRPARIAVGVPDTHHPSVAIDQRQVCSVELGRRTRRYTGCVR
jgi:hypothetical protein